MVNGIDSSKTFGKSISRDSFESIVTLSTKDIPNDAIDSWDVSNSQNGSIMAWCKDNNNAGLY